MLVAYWHMFTNGETYRDLGGDYYQRRDPERLTRRLLARLESLGHTVTLQTATAQTVVAASTLFPISFPHRLRRWPAAG